MVIRLPPPESDRASVDEPVFADASPTTAHAVADFSRKPRSTPVAAGQTTNGRIPEAANLSFAAPKLACGPQAP
jgi:hypothetical protein